MPEPALSPELESLALRLAGLRPDRWLCPVCGQDVADQDVADQSPPLHQHHGRRVELIWMWEGSSRA